LRYHGRIIEYNLLSINSAASALRSNATFGFSTTVRYGACAITTNYCGVLQRMHFCACVRV